MRLRVRGEDVASSIGQLGPKRTTSHGATTINASKLRREFLRPVIVLFSSG
jgi:hypothetical protein